MKWHFPTWNHGTVSCETLRDILDPISNALTAMGHTVTTEEEADILVYTEYFMMDKIEPIFKSKKTYGVICTEWFNGKEIIGREPNEIEAFLKVVEKATFLWAYSDADQYSKLGRPTAPILIGWEPNSYKPTRVEPTYDVCFYGSMSPMRQDILNALRKTTAEVLVVPFGSKKEDRDASIWQSRYVLDMPAHSWKSSDGRRNTALHADRPIISIQDAMQIDQWRSRWQEERKMQLAEFMARPSLREILTKALKKVKP